MTLEQFLSGVSNGAFFRVDFVKRTNGEARHMRCRVGVKKYLRGGPPAYDPKNKDLIWVFDMDIMEYRSIPIEGIRELRFFHRTYDFDPATRVFSEVAR